MLVEKCIKERRSVRKYTEEEVTKEIIEQIVDLARFAPSWKNTQVIRYHVIKNKNIKNEIGKECVEGFEFNTKTITRSNALVVVTGVENICGYESDGSFSSPQKDKWEFFDGGVAIQTFCLAAYAKGVGSIILGKFDEEKICEYITLPKEEKIIALVGLGYPLDKNKEAPKRKEVEELVSFID